MKTSDNLRLDKWLWSARFYKTRSLAADGIGKGRVQVNGITAKPSRDLKLGDMISLRLESGSRIVQVLQLNSQRGSATVAQQMYEETPESLAGRAAAAEQRRLSPEPALAQLAGRPTKRDRRDLQQQTDGWNGRWSASIDM